MSTTSHLPVPRFVLKNFTLPIRKGCWAFSSHTSSRLSHFQLTHCTLTTYLQHVPHFHNRDTFQRPFTITHILRIPLYFQDYQQALSSLKTCQIVNPNYLHSRAPYTILVDPLTSIHRTKMCIYFCIVGDCGHYDENWLLRTELCAKEEECVRNGWPDLNTGNHACTYKHWRGKHACRQCWCYSRIATSRREDAQLREETDGKPRSLGAMPTDTEEQKRRN